MSRGVLLRLVLLDQVNVVGVVRKQFLLDLVFFQSLDFLTLVVEDAVHEVEAKV